jgi:hypothetical protein
MSPKTWLSLISVLLFGCVAQRPIQSVQPVEPAQTAQPQWTVESIIGLRISLVDKLQPKHYSELFFGPGGTLAISVGIKGEWETNPLTVWKLVDGRLHMGFDKTSSGWTLVSRNPSTIVIRTETGELQTYRIIERPH